MQLNHLEKQVGKKGMIALAPWSYKLNALLRIVFEKDALIIPPAITEGKVILVLYGYDPFEYYYIQFPLEKFLSTMNRALSEIQIFGIKGIITEPTLPLELSTAAKKGSFVSFSREIF